jgi:hypothetical protein
VNEFTSLCHTFHASSGIGRGVEYIIHKLIYGSSRYVGLAFTTIDEVVDYIKEHSVVTTSDTEEGRR